MIKLTYSPWGVVDESKELAKDLVWFAGKQDGLAVRGETWDNVLAKFPNVMDVIGRRSEFHILYGKTKKMLNAMRGIEADPEDLHWFAGPEAAFVVIANPALFSGEEYIKAERNLKDWFPDSWEDLSGELPKPEESRVIRMRIFAGEHENDSVAVTSRPLDDRMRLVIAERCNEEKAFFVPKERYEGHGEYPYVIDTDKDEASPFSAEESLRLYDKERLLSVRAFHEEAEKASPQLSLA